MKEKRRFKLNKLWLAAALSVLGYNPTEINAVLSKMDITELSVEEAIRQVLKSSLR